MQTPKHKCFFFSLILNILKTFIHLNGCRCLLSAEDPSENYVKLRDFVLSKLCQSLPAFAADKLPLGFSDEMVKEAQDKLKINKVEHHADNSISGLDALPIRLKKKNIYVLFFLTVETRETRV